MAQGGRQAELQAGEMSLVQAGSPYEIRLQEPNRMVVVALPAWEGPARLDAHLAVRHATDEAALVGGLLRRLQHLSDASSAALDPQALRVIPAGARAIVSYGSANRDERRFPDPDRFHIERRPLDHLGFGLGVHGCAGQSLARLEAHAVFTALARHVSRFELAGPPQRALNNINRGHAAMPMRAVP